MALHMLRILTSVVGGSFSTRRTLPSRGMLSLPGTCHLCAHCKPSFSDRKDVVSSQTQLQPLAGLRVDLGSSPSTSTGHSPPLAGKFSELSDLHHLYQGHPHFLLLASVQLGQLPCRKG